jgi:hypothetical protein
MSSVRRGPAWIIAGALTLFPAAASAVTVDQIVALSKSGVSETVILGLMQRDRTVLTIEPEQLATLKREGLSDTLIMAMLKNGRDEADQAAQAVSAEKAATILASLSSTPEVAVVGHGPERPNTVYTEDLYAGLRDGVVLPAAVPYASPYAIPYGAFGVGIYRKGPGARSQHSQHSQQSQYSSQAPPPQARSGMLCLAHVNTNLGPGPSYITQCPAVMQSPFGAR